VLGRATAFDTDALRRVLMPEEEELIRQQPLTGWLHEHTNYARRCLPEVPVEYHILTGLILEAGVLGGKAKTDTGLQANLAGVIVAFQGSGKSLPAVISRQLIDPIEQEEERAFREKLSELKAELEKVSHELVNADGDSQEELSARQRELEGEIEQMERAGRPAIIIATQASVEGLLEALSCYPCGIADFDEFGAFLKDCRRDHMRSARENLIKALDGRPIYYRRTRGQSVDVGNPALSQEAISKPCTIV
jgi:hypothetical protein